MSLKATRKKHRYSQAELARSIGVTQVRVSQWEAGESITPEHCVAIERVLGIPCEKLRSDLQWVRDEQGNVISYCVHISS